MKQIQLSDNFTYRNLIRFTLAPVISMVFASVYGIIDGVFVANFAGTTAFAAINFSFPFLMIFSCFGFMIGTGGSALVSKYLGEGRKQTACEVFSQLIYVLIGFGIFVTILSEILLRPALIFLGADDSFLDLCVIYGRIGLLTTVPYMLQYAMQNLLVTAERPRLGLYITILAGVANIILDTLFVGVLRWGVAGAAYATAISECLGGFIPLLYFIIPNSSLLQLGKPCRRIRPLLQAMTNGISEFLSQITMSLVNSVYNIQLLRLLGTNGISAYGTVMYITWIFFSVYLGYSNGVGPVVGYKYGAQDHEQLKGILRRSIILIGITSLVLFAIAEALARPLAMIFTNSDPELLELSARALRIYALCYIPGGWCVFGSAFFTGLNNGIVSGVISFMRSMVFELAAILLIPLVFGAGSIWFCTTVAEIAALALTIFCIIRFRNRYHYL